MVLSFKCFASPSRQQRFTFCGIYVNSPQTKLTNYPACYLLLFIKIGYQMLALLFHAKFIIPKIGEPKCWLYSTMQFLSARITGTRSISPRTVEFTSCYLRDDQAAASKVVVHMYLHPLHQFYDHFIDFTRTWPERKLQRYKVKFKQLEKWNKFE